VIHDDEREQGGPVEPEEAAPEVAAAVPDAVVPLARRPMWQRVAQLLLPLVLAGAAMGVHWRVNVPDEIIVSSSDQGAKDKKAEKDKKKKKDAERSRNTKREESRTPEELDTDWASYGAAPFDVEPTRSAWARRHQVVINRAMVEAQRQAFAGAPEKPNVVLTSTTCRTVRCRFLLRSSFPHELDLMTSALQRLHSEGEPVWRTFDIEPVAATEDPKADPNTEHVVQVTVSFRTDDTEASTLEVPAATPTVEPEEDAEPEQGGDPEPGTEPENEG
jgi:hypothetical protein